MKTRPMPKTDSIQKLARFWDTHDLSDFEDELVEVTDTLFEPTDAIAVNLSTSELAAVRKLARRSGLDDAELLKRWIRERLSAKPRARKRSVA